MSTFTAAGVVEWLCGLRRAVAAVLGSKAAAPHVPMRSDAIYTADLRSSPS